MRQVFLPPIPHKFPFLGTFTALTFSTTPFAFRALSKVYFSSSQVIRQTGFSYLSLNLSLWTQAFLLFYPSLSLFTTLFFWIYPFPFPSLFPCPFTGTDKKLFPPLSYISSCLHISGCYREPNGQNEVNAVHACIFIYTLKEILSSEPLNLSCPCRGKNK